MRIARPPARHRTATPIAAAFAGTLATALLGSAVVGIAPAQAATRKSTIDTAAAYAKHAGYHIGIAVLDTATGKYYGAGTPKATFASESVVKTFIATRLLVSGRMHGETERMAYKMITQSDDGMASALYSRVGGDSLIDWVKQHYHLPGLGSPPRRTYWWGNTHITAAGLVHFYAKVKKDRRVGPWLIHAMHHATHYGSDGTYQFFGLGVAAPGSAIKQGWGADYDDWSRSADFNTTGFVDGNRYAVAILARGPISTYGAKISGMLTHTAQLLLPGGRFPAGRPTIRTLSAHRGGAAGGTRLTIRGTDFSGVRSVLFGRTAGTHLHVSSAARLEVTAPQHHAGAVNVRVVTNHGTSAATAAARFTYAAPAPPPAPVVTALSPATGPITGGTRVTITGRNLEHVTAVRFGDIPATDLTAVGGGIVVTAPAVQRAGRVDVLVATATGTSTAAPGDVFTYTDPATAASAVTDSPP